MNSFGDDDDAESRDNDQDHDMDGDGDIDVDGYGNGENDEENEDNGEDDDDPDQDDSQDLLGEPHDREQLKATNNPQATFLPEKSSPLLINGGAKLPAPTSHPHPAVLLTSPSPTQIQPASRSSNFNSLQVRPEALTAQVYDIVPTIAAPHSTSINSITATPDLRWVFSGGADGYIRKFNWIETANGKSMLTVAQRHPFVDSVTKAGVLMSYWENEDAQGKREFDQETIVTDHLLWKVKASVGDDGSALSPVYSLAVQHKGLWLLSGLESGGINLQSVRHDEGKQIASLRQHTSAVSVLTLAQDETSLLSGSWDKNVIDWDLNTGQEIRRFQGSGGQISALENRPLSSLTVPEVSGDLLPNGTTFSTNGIDEPHGDDSITTVADHDLQNQPDQQDTLLDAPGSPADSLFGGDDADSLFDDNDDGQVAAPSAGNFVDEDDDEFSRAIANGVQQEENEETAREAGAADAEAAGFPTINGNMDTQLTSSTSDANLVDTGSQPGTSSLTNGLPHAEDLPPQMSTTAAAASPAAQEKESSDSTFLVASMDGSLRIWDKRRPTPIAKIPRNVPPWCMNVCWSPDGNFIYAGRRNGTVEEFSLHKGLHEVNRSFKLPNGSGPVSAVRAMPNGRHLICASYDILRLYDLEQQQTFKHSTVPFLIIPGHRTGVVSQLYIDPTCRYMISTAGNRGWEGASTEVLLGYEIGVGK
ncbi:MAG: hypothetical protein LQ342_000118 [Letrouitia transgressa]|nr:MAG: hypothetical protein LQ342_000118 [Letrouitia transgressa]